jgi:hypothetical protein
MEVKQFRDSRNEKLSEFQKEFTDNKELYSSALHNAILETDPAQQEQLIQQVLQINAELSSGLRTIIGDLNKGTDSFDPKTIDDLTDDLIKYQQQYEEIQKSKNRAATLRLIKGSTLKNLQDATSKYYALFYSLIALVFILIFIIIRTGWNNMPSLTSFFTQPSESLLSLP